MLSKTHSKYIQTLHHKKNRDTNNVFIAEGNKTVMDLLQSQKTVCAPFSPHPSPFLRRFIDRPYARTIFTRVWIFWTIDGASDTGCREPLNTRRRAYFSSEGSSFLEHHFWMPCMQCHSEPRKHLHSDQRLWNCPSCRSNSHTCDALGRTTGSL